MGIKNGFFSSRRTKSWAIKSLLFLALWSVTPTRAQGETSPPPDAKLELTTEKTSFALGEPIAITVRFTTTGAPFHVIRFGVDWLYLSFAPSFSATDEHGAAVQPRLGPMRSVWIGSLDEVKVTVDQPHGPRVYLNEWLALDKPGRYSVFAQRKVALRPGFPHGSSGSKDSLLLTSAPLAIEITLPDEAARRNLFERAARGDGNSIDIMRELRLIGDERALPFLARGLFTDGFVAQHAVIGLRNYPEAAKVKVALLQLLTSPGPPLRPIGFTLLPLALTDADMRLQYPDIKPRSRAYGEAYNGLIEQWNSALRPRLKAEIARLPRAAAAEATVEALGFESIASNDIELWRRALTDAALLSREKQRWLGGQFWRLPHDARLHTLLTPLAADKTIDLSLRGAALNELLQKTETVAAAREVIFRDLASPSPQFGKEIHARLGPYKQRERATLLLSRLRAVRDEQQRQTAAEYVRDCGQGATLGELRAAFVSHAKYSPAVSLPILEAIALHSPRESFSILKPLLANRRISHDALYERALKRLYFPEARALIVQILRNEPDERESLLGALNITDSPRWPARGLPWMAVGRERYVGEVLRLVEKSPSTRALRFMQLATHVPPGSVEVNTAFAANRLSLLTAWRDWWKKNEARFVK